MRIDSPKVSNLTFQTGSGVADSSFTGSFTGSFSGVGNFTGLTADNVEYANVLNKPAGLVSGSASQARSQIGVVIGTDVQAFQQNLTDISNLNPTDGTFIVGAGSSFVAESGATARTSLGLGSLAILNTDSSLNSVDLSSNSSYSFANLSNLPSLVSGSASDVRSFINVEDGATADQTAAEIRTLVESATDSNVFTDADHTKLDGIEASADVTDATNVQAAGALMDSEVTDLAGIKALTVSSKQDVLSEGAFADGDKTKLDGIEDGATADQTAAEIKTAYESNSDTNAFDDAAVSKLAGIEASADVTDTANVTAAGALMDTEVSSLSGIKTLTVPDSTTISSFGASLVDDADASAARTTLGVDAAGTDNSTDVSLSGTPDYITISGQVITRNKINLATDVEGTLPVGNMSATALTTVQTAANESAQLALTTQEGDVVVRTDENKTYMHNGGTAGTMADFTELATPTDSVTSVNGNTGAVTVTENVTTNLSTTANGTSLVINSSDGTNASIPAATTSAWGAMTDEDKSKLDGIEASADVTDTANVTAAGALMDSEVTNLAQVKSFDSSDYATAAQGALADSALQSYGSVTNHSDVSDAGSGAIITSAERTKLSGIATSANNYSHPTYAGDDFSVDSGALTGATVISDIDINVTTDTLGHVTDANGTVSTRTITLADLGYSGDTNANYITNNNQLTNGAGYTTYSSNQTLNNNSNVHFEGLMVGQTTGATANTIRCIGDIVAYYSSDQQFKDNIVTLEGALDKVKAIRGVRFDWNDKQDVYEGHDIGVVAQEVEAVLPELVHYREHNDSKAVDYVKLTAVLIEAVKELSAKVEALENK